MKEKINFFKSEDFQQYCGPFNDISAKEIAGLANAKLEKEGAKVFCNGHTWTANKDNWSTHQGLIICIEHVEQCDHPMEKIRSIFNESMMKRTNLEFRCACGAMVRPTGFEEIK